jgi:hypothetical protein
LYLPEKDKNYRPRLQLLNGDLADTQRQNPQQLTLCPSTGTVPALAGSESSLANAVGRNRHTRKLLLAAPTPS